MSEKAAMWSQAYLRDPLNIMGQGTDVKEHAMPTSQRQALARLDLDETASLREIKMRYKQLVKRFHPDVTGGDKQAEETFKAISEAYDSLLACGYYSA